MTEAKRVRLDTLDRQAPAYVDPRHIVWIENAKTGSEPILVLTLISGTEKRIADTPENRHKILYVVPE